MLMCSVSEKSERAGTAGSVCVCAVDQLDDLLSFIIERISY